MRPRSPLGPTSQDCGCEKRAKVLFGGQGSFIRIKGSLRRYSLPQFVIGHTDDR